MSTKNAAPQPDGGDAKSRRTIDPLAYEIFRLLRHLSQACRRLVFDALAAADTSATGPRARASILYLQRCATDLGCTPAKKKYESWRLALDEAGVPSASAIASPFGSWSGALDAAGLEPGSDLHAVRVRSHRAPASDEQVISSVQEFAAETPRPWTFKDWRGWVERRERAMDPDAPMLPGSLTTITRRFRSWRDLLIRAGVYTGPPRRNPEITVSALVRERARRYAQECRDRSALDWVRLAADVFTPAALTMQGFIDWRGAVLAELEPHDQRLIPSVNTLRRLYGSWPKVLLAAGLITEQEASRVWRGQSQRMRDQVLIDSLAMAIAELGPQLTRRQYDEWRAAKLSQPHPPRLVHQSIILRRPGGWPHFFSLALGAWREGESQGRRAA